MKTEWNNLKQLEADPFTTAGVGIGMGLVNNVSNLVFGKKAQEMQLEGQKKALQQQNEANYDYWLKTNYKAQKGQLTEAGLNPGLIYGMGGAGGQSAGASAMPDQTVKPGGMDIAGAAQLALINAQTKNIEADTKNKLRGAGEGEAGKTDVAKVAQDTATGKSQQGLNEAQLAFDKIRNDIQEYGQYYQMGKIEAGWKQAEAEARSAMTKANVDTVVQETRIKQEKENLATTLLTQKAIKAGTALTQQQIQSEIGNLINNIRNSWTGRINAETGQAQQMTNEQRLQFDKQIHDVADSLKLSVETVQDVIQALLLKDVLSPKVNRTPGGIGFKPQK